MNLRARERGEARRDETLGPMVQIGYVKMEEVRGIPRLPETPGAVTYAPLGDTPALLEFLGRVPRAKEF